MDDTISTIEKLIKEHQEIRGNLRACDIFISDIEQAQKLGEAMEGLVPGRLEDHKKKAAQLEHELMKVDNTLKAHFECEEESLLSAFENNRLPELASALSKLVAEHQEISNHLAERNLSSRLSKITGFRSWLLLLASSWRSTRRYQIILPI